jgi:hypothetical protein
MKNYLVSFAFLAMAAVFPRAGHASYFLAANIMADTFPSPVLEPPFGPEAVERAKEIKNYAPSEYSYEKGIGSASTASVIFHIPVPVSDKHTKLLSLPPGYTGFKVQIAEADQSLPKDHYIFTQHGEIAMDRKADGAYSYLLGDFKMESEARAHLDNLLRGRYPDAKVIRYETGRRLNN